PAGRTHSRSTVRFPLTACDATRWRRWLPLPQGSASGRPVPVRGCGKAEGCSMKLAVSNLAWPVESDPAAADLLSRHGIRAIEIAPTKIWPRPAEATEGDVVAYRSFWERRGFQIMALQALLFGRPDLMFFGDADTRA